MLVVQILATESHIKRNRSRGCNLVRINLLKSECYCAGKNSQKTMEHRKNSYVYEYPKGHFPRIPKPRLPTTTTTATTTTTTENIVQTTLSNLQTAINDLVNSTTESILTQQNPGNRTDLIQNGTSVATVDGNDLDESLNSNRTIIETGTMSQVSETTSEAIRKGIDWLGQMEDGNQTTNLNHTFVYPHDDYGDRYLPIYIILSAILGLMCIVCLILGVTYYMYKKRNQLNHPQQSECNFGIAYSQTIETKDF